jgi:hypothetical protein
MVGPKLSLPAASASEDSGMKPFTVGLENLVDLKHDINCLLVCLGYAGNSVEAATRRSSRLWYFKLRRRSHATV